MEPVVLAADDDEDAQFLLRRAFAQAGVSATLKQVSDGAEAINYLEGNGDFANRAEFPLPRLLLLDLKMPQVSGFRVLEYLNECKIPRSFAVVVFSSSDHLQDIQRAQALGCDTYLVKPTDFGGLVTLMKTLDVDYLRGELAAHRARDTVSVPPPSPHTGMEKRRNLQEKPRKSFAPESPEVFHLLVEQVKDYAICLLDTEGYVRSWNEGARRIKGYEAHEIIGRHFSLFYPRQDLESEKPQFELRMAREMGRYEEEGWRVRKDGSRFWANVLVTPLRDASGELTGFAKVTRDLTQRKFQEEHLQRLLESEERFRLLVEQVRDYAIFFLDARGNISSWNQGARRIKGYTADEAIGRHFSIFYPAEDLASDKPNRELTIAIREGRYEEEGWRLKKDGSRFWASVIITSLWDKRGNLSGFAKVTRDLTDRKREEEALRTRTKELEAFAHTLSHDLRTPIRSISSFAQILTADAGQLSSTEQKGYLERISKAAQGMETLIRDILKLSEVSMAPVEKADAQLEEILDEILDLLERDIQQTGASIQIHKPLPLFWGNRTLYIQIFSNLVSNALKFANPGQPPRIEIFAEHQESSCQIHVRDHGIGISPENRESIFEVFNRGSAGSAYAGTGIGLAIVRKAVERLGGTISVVSTNGDGSDFVIKLPCEAAVPADA